MVTAELVQRLLADYSLHPEGVHGVTHWARVLENGRRLALATGAKRPVVELFSVFHDACRVADGRDPDHGRRGAERARALRGVLFDLSDEDFELLHEACCLHTAGLTAGDVTIQTAWDADRLDLGRVGSVPDPRLLCTDAARDPEMIAWATERARARLAPPLLAREWQVTGIRATAPRSDRRSRPAVADLPARLADGERRTQGGLDYHVLPDCQAFLQWAVNNGFLLHGSPALISSLEPHQGRDSTLRSGNRCAVYLSCNPLVAIFCGLVERPDGALRVADVVQETSNRVIRYHAVRLAVDQTCTIHAHGYVYLVGADSADERVEGQHLAYRDLEPLATIRVKREDLPYDIETIPS